MTEADVRARILARRAAFVAAALASVSAACTERPANEPSPQTVTLDPVDSGAAPRVATPVVARDAGAPPDDPPPPPVLPPNVCLSIERRP